MAVCPWLVDTALVRAGMANIGPEERQRKEQTGPLRVISWLLGAFLAFRCGLRAVKGSFTGVPMPERHLKRQEMQHVIC